MNNNQKIASEVKKRIKNLRYGKIYNYSLFDDILNRNALYVTLNRLVKAKKIERFSKGKFFKVKILKEEFSSDSFYEYTTSVDNSSKWEQILGKDGIVVGNSLYNRLGLTTQNTFLTEVAQYRGKNRFTKIYNTKIKYKPLPLKPTNINREAIILIEVISNKRDILDIIEKEYIIFTKEYLTKVSISVLLKTIKAYPKPKQLAFLREMKKVDKNVFIVLLENSRGDIK